MSISTGIPQSPPPPAPVANHSVQSPIIENVSFVPPEDTMESPEEIEQSVVSRVGQDDTQPAALQEDKRIITAHMEDLRRRGVKVYQREHWMGFITHAWCHFGMSMKENSVETIPHVSPLSLDDCRAIVGDILFTTSRPHAPMDTARAGHHPLFARYITLLSTKALSVEELKAIIPEETWDFTTLSATVPRHLCLRRIGKYWTVQDLRFPSSSFRLMFESAQAVLACLRLYADHDGNLEQYVTTCCVERGIPFLLCRRTTGTDNNMFPTSPNPTLPIRSADYQPGRGGYMAYEMARDDLLRSPRGRAALRMGGIIWRLSVETISPERLLRGPSEYATTQIQDGDSIWVEDVITEVEMNVICGMYNPLTGWESNCTEKLVAKAYNMEKMWLTSWLMDSCLRRLVYGEEKRYSGG
ncbi:hypothetical protein BXZ70DRAFT_1009316 [Cristinia sonorae]|uniref:Uncharacterized protein n=1 Tax=Cristinia sonorae TaxID=1940300 RepID=A0A8K0ULI0_9AGAR|nr:hypothetical protein BXZ70DRAFT_1009316 [Cristinia sonorae]